MAVASSDDYVVMSDNSWDFLKVFLIALALCGISLAIPGYFAFDEFSFMMPQAMPGGLSLYIHPGNGFWRPLGFFLLRHVLVLTYPPIVAHAMNVCVHAIACALLYGYMRLWSASRRALWASIGLAVSPLAAFSVGWVVAIYDILFGLFALILSIGILKYLATGKFRWAFVAMLATVLGLLSKETAVIYPAIALLNIAPVTVRQKLCWHGRRPIIALMVVALPVILYLSARMPGLLHAAALGAGGYNVDMHANVVRNLVAYLAFPFYLNAGEITAIAVLQPVELALLCMLTLGLYVLVSIRGRWLWLSLAAFVLPLVPVLAINKHETQYLYGSAIAFAIAVSSLVDISNKPLIRLVGAAAMLALAAHAFTIQYMMYKTGACQQRLFDYLDVSVTGLPDSVPGSESIKIGASADAPWWVLARVANGWNLLNPMRRPISFTLNNAAAQWEMTGRCEIVFKDFNKHLISNGKPESR